MTENGKASKTHKFHIIVSVVSLLIILVILFNINFKFSLDNKTTRLAAGYPPDGAEYLALIGVALLLAYIFMLNRFFINKLTQRKKIAANVIVVILFFLILESALHHYSSKHNEIDFLPHPTLLWVQAKRINKVGFNYSEFPIKKEPGEFRFVLVGDSNAEGKRGTRFSDLAESELGKIYPGRPIRIINAACSGYSIVQVYNLVKMKVFKLNPDYIIISLNNDPTYDFEQDKKRLPPPALASLMNVLYKSDLYLLIRKNKLNRDYQLYDHNKDFKEAHNTQRVLPDDVDKYYGDLISDAQKRGIGVIIIAMPSNYPDEKGRVMDLRYKKHLRVIAEKWNVLFLDLYSSWQEQDNSRLFADYVHSTEEGHKKIAEDLLKFFKDNKIIK